MNHDRLLDTILPYRMTAVDMLRAALELRANWHEAPSMALCVDGMLRVEGNLNAFTNPAIEAGLMHSRALLEFLGLCERSGSLCNIKSRHADDVGIEHFVGAHGQLQTLAPEVVMKSYPGGAAEAEHAFLAVFQVTNKGLAHTTETINDDPESVRLLEIASRGIPFLMITYLYTPLLRPSPDYKITTRSLSG